MPNMNYCRFRNTSSDLDECLQTIEEGDLDLSQEEAQALRSMVVNFYEFLVNYELLDEDGELDAEALDEFIHNTRE